MGEGTAYFIKLLPQTRRVVKYGIPLDLGTMAAYRLDANKTGGRFDLVQWSGSGGTAYSISVDAGIVIGYQAGPSHTRKLVGPYGPRDAVGRGGGGH